MLIFTMWEHNSKMDIFMSFYQERGWFLSKKKSRTWSAVRIICLALNEKKNKKSRTWALFSWEYSFPIPFSWNKND
jgi:hypothetical protein